MRRERSVFALTSAIGCAIVIFLSIGVAGMFSLFIPEYMAEYGYSKMEMSYVAMVATVSGFLFSLIGSKLINALGPKKSLLVGSLASAVFLCLIGSVDNLVALGLVYFILASQFESFLMPVIVMMILPVAFAGALFALPLTGRDLSMISLVALIMLAGTVVNASIILVDYVSQRRERGESREEAILHACPLRVRPVLMTTLTTILALVPMALGMAEGAAEMMSDMSITMIAGMGISTVITLIFTPVYYSVIDNLSHIFRRKKDQGPPSDLPSADEALEPAAADAAE